MEKEELQQTWKRAEATRMALVEKIKSKQNEGRLSFSGENPITESFIEDYNNLVDEHNYIAEIQKSLKDSAKEYASMTGDNSFQDQFVNAGGIFSKLKTKIDTGAQRMRDRQEVRKETKADILAKGGTKKEARKGAREAILEKNLSSRFVQKFKTVNLAGFRIPCLSIIRINLWGMASSMFKWKTSNPEKYNNVRNQWYRLGGNRTDFDNAVMKGAKLKPIRFLMKKDIIKAKFTGQSELNIAGYDDAIIAGYISAGASVLGSLVKAFKKEGGVPDAPEGSAMPEIDPKDQQLLDDVADAVDSGAVDPDSNSTYWIIGIVGFGVAVGIFFTIRHFVNKGKGK